MYEDPKYTNQDSMDFMVIPSNTQLCEDKKYTIIQNNYVNAIVYSDCNVVTHLCNGKTLG